MKYVHAYRAAPVSYIKYSLACTYVHAHTHYTHLPILLNKTFEMFGQHFLLLLHWEGGIDTHLGRGAGGSLPEEGQYQVHILQGKMSEGQRQQRDGVEKR